MKSKFVKSRICYSGEQLCSHFAYNNYDIAGDSIVSFVGPCDVRENMVDLEDIKSGQLIKSDEMLHFIIEHFDLDLGKAIFKQRLLISIIQQSINEKSGKLEIIRRGNDLYHKNKKLSVSIAALSPVSSLIHIGLNIMGSGAPVPIIGLNELRIDPISFARIIMKSYINELDQIEFSKCKVKGIR